MAISSLTPKSWSLKSYPAATWTDLVLGSANGDTVKSINIANISVSDVTVSIRVVSSGGAALATILPDTIFSAGIAQQLNIDSLNLTSSQKIQINADISGAEFYASGMSY